LTKTPGECEEEEDRYPPPPAPARN
jgi:hypothetical protein